MGAERFHHEDRLGEPRLAAGQPATRRRGGNLIVEAQAANCAAWQFPPMNNNLYDLWRMAYGLWCAVWR
eukprot:2849431-Prymnesium_polylepis.2